MGNRVQQMQIQVVAKAEVANAIGRIRPHLLRARADLIDAVTGLQGTRAIIAASCEALKGIPLIGAPFDRNSIAGDEELEHLDMILKKLDAIGDEIEGLFGGEGAA